jgi:hypothetical protein
VHGFNAGKLRALDISHYLVDSSNHAVAEYVGGQNYTIELRANYFVMGFIGFYANMHFGE